MASTRRPRPRLLLRPFSSTAKAKATGSALHLHDAHAQAKPVAQSAGQRRGQLVQAGHERRQPRRIAARVPAAVSSNPRARPEPDSDARAPGTAISGKRRREADHIGIARVQARHHNLIMLKLISTLLTV